MKAALRRLAAGGVETVRVELLARDLGVTKGSFYWHFKERSELLDAVLEQWEATTERVIGSAAQAATPSERMARFLELAAAWAADADEAALESAVLAWAQKDAAVAERVAAVEAIRTKNAERLLLELGFPPAEAASWADIGYTTVVGLMSRSTRDPRFRPWPQTGYLTRLVEAARALVEREETAAYSRGRKRTRTASARSSAKLQSAVRGAATSALARAERAQRIADLVRRATGRRWVGVYEVTPTEVVNLAWSGPGPPAHLRFPLARGLTGVAIATRDTIVSNDVARDPRYLTALASTGSELIAPVVVGERVVGTLDVEDEHTEAFSDADRRLLERVAGEMGPLYQ